MTNVIALEGARSSRHKSGSSPIICTPSVELSGRKPQRRHSNTYSYVEKLVFETLVLARDLDGRDAADRLSERLILQIASRVAVECGRDRALAMLEAAAAGTIEVDPVRA
jgi:hypothetical protein